MSLNKIMEICKKRGAVLGENNRILNYNNLKAAYQAVRQGSGIYIDLHSKLFSIRGQDSADYLNKLVTGNIQFLEYNHICYTALLDTRGNIIDLLHIFRTLEGFLILASPGQGAKVYSILEQDIPGDVTLTDETGKSAIISLEGVYSWEYAKELAGPDIVGLRFHGFLNTSIHDIPDVYCARCGVTGEYGFKFIFPAEYAEKFIKYVFECKTDHPRELFGWESLSLLTQEVRFPIFGIGIREGDNPIEKGLSWMIDWRKEIYNGKAELEKSFRNNKLVKKQIGFSCEQEEATIKPEDKILIGEREIGEVLMTTFSHKLNRTIGYGMFDIDWACVGIDAYQIRSSSGLIPVKTLSTPFFLTESVNIEMI